MSITTPKMAIDLNTTGYEIHRLISELYPICRSITGNGVRQTLHLINGYIRLSMHEVPTGTRVFDWVVPKEWNIRDGYVKNSRGEKIIDFQKSNLHAVGYSIPIHQKMSLEELRPTYSLCLNTLIGFHIGILTTRKIGDSV